MRTAAHSFRDDGTGERGGHRGVRARLIVPTAACAALVVSASEPPNIEDRMQAAASAGKPEAGSAAIPPGYRPIRRHRGGGHAHTSLYDPCSAGRRGSQWASEVVDARRRNPGVGKSRLQQLLDRLLRVEADDVIRHIVVVGELLERNLVAAGLQSKASGEIAYITFRRGHGPPSARRGAAFRGHRPIPPRSRRGQP